MAKQTSWKPTLAVLGGGCAILFVQEVVVERQNNANINPAVYDAFKQIKQQAQANYELARKQGKDPEVSLTRRELWVYREMNAPNESDHVKYADAYYDELRERDFELPPFYRAGYRAKTPWWKFWAKTTYARRNG